MLKEIEKYTPKHQIFLLLQVIGIVFGMLIFTWFCNAFKIVFGISLIAYLPFPAAFLIVIWLYQKRIVEYQYTLTNDILKIEKLYGKRASLITNISIANIDAYTPYNKKSSPKPRYKCIFSTSKNPTVLTYTQNGKQETILFSPSKRMDELIRSQLP